MPTEPKAASDMDDGGTAKLSAIAERNVLDIREGISTTGHP